jgi:hypothetical protein
MSDLLDTVDYKGYKINIYPDSDTESPESWEDKNGLMIISFHRHYGSNHGYSTPEDAVADLKKSHHLFVVRAYEHSGISFSLSKSTYPFNDQWDSYDYGILAIPKSEWKTRAKALKYAGSWIKMYSAWAAGSVYYIEVKSPEDEDVDSCGGFIGADGLKDGITEMKASIDNFIKLKSSKFISKRKAQIKAKVPLAKREHFSGEMRPNPMPFKNVTAHVDNPRSIKIGDYVNFWRGDKQENGFIESISFPDYYINMSKVSGRKNIVRVSFRDIIEFNKNPCHTKNELGKFQGEPKYTEYFYNLMLDGDGKNFVDTAENGYTGFSIENEDIKKFPDLAGYSHIIIYTSNDGFVGHILFHSEREYQKGIKHIENPAIDGRKTFLAPSLDEPTYKVVRFYRDSGRRKIIMRHVSLEVAQLHCRSEKTHRLDKTGSAIWFDGYEKE